MTDKSSVFYKLINPMCKPLSDPTTGLYNLVSNTDIWLYPNNQCKVYTGISFNLHSSLNILICNTQIQANNGISIQSPNIITSKYTDIVQITLVNNGANTYKIKQGITKVAQFSLVHSFSESLREYNNDKN